MNSSNPNRLLYMVAISCLWFSISLAHAQTTSSYQLSGEMVAFGGVSNRQSGYQISQDGKTVVYMADQNTDGFLELFSVPITGGVVERLNANLVAGGDVWDFQISQVVYRADQNTSGKVELFVVPISGGTPRQVNVDLPSNRFIGFNKYKISADGDSVVYIANPSASGAQELFSTSISGNELIRIRISDDLVSNGNVQDFQISPDGSQVVYRADQYVDNRIELFNVSVAGGPVVRLNGNLAINSSDVRANYKISPDGGRVVYNAPQNLSFLNELFSVPITGGTPVRLNANLVTDGRISRGYQISPDGVRVLYHADQNISGKFEIFSVPITGGIPVRLNAELPVNGDVREVFLISSDGERVVYRADQITDEKFEIFSVPISGGIPVRLNINLPQFSDTNPVQISPDSSRVVYQVLGGVWMKY